MDFRRGPLLEGLNHGGADVLPCLRIERYHQIVVATISPALGRECHKEATTCPFHDAQAFDEQTGVNDDIGISTGVSPQATRLKRINTNLVDAHHWIYLTVA